MKETYKGFCDICGIEINVTMCCNGDQCGCLGMPIDPPICSPECWAKSKWNPENKNDNKLKENG